MNSILRLVVAHMALGLLVSPAVAERPNVIVILSDDQGWGDFSANGNTNLSTPNIDSLARGGASFDRYYACPVCAPTRAEFLTGRYHLRGGVRGVSQGRERLDLDETTIADTFKAAGYATGAFGKWHNGSQFPYHPTARGFDEFYGFLSGHLDDYHTPVLDHNGELVRGEKYVSDDFTDKTIAFIEQNQARPFFAYLAFNSPHSPMQVPDRWWNAAKNRDLTLHGTQARQEDIDHTRAALAMCENLDWNVGRLLKRLDELDLTKNTIVLYFCDNGPNGHRWNGGMKGIKGSVDEGGVRSPLFVRWPAHIMAGTRIDQIAGAIDLLPTLAALCDVPTTGKQQLDGLDLSSLLLTAPSESEFDDAAMAKLRDRRLFHHWAGKTSVRANQFRLDSDGKLFDVLADPGQTKNLARRNPDVQAQLAAAAEAWTKEMQRESSQGDAPFTVGHPSGKSTVLPARDGNGHGNITRSSRAPNSSYFTNWKDTSDSITWDIEVLEPGDYDVELFYTCSTADVGSTVELSFSDTRLTGRIAEARDPPVRGSEHDRVPRNESYTKDFRPLKLGTVRFEKGRGQLTLRAIQVAGAQVADVRLLRLTRQANP